jgi:hypothetical protein
MVRYPEPRSNLKGAFPLQDFVIPV